MADINKKIVFYNRIKDNLGVKFIIVHPDSITNEEKINVYSSLSMRCIAAINLDKEYDFASICLDALDILPGNLSEYPRVVILYDDSSEDRIYNLDTDKLDDYQGDIFDMQYGRIIRYADTSNCVTIGQSENIDSNSDEYSCYINNSRQVFIPSIFEETSCNSPHLQFARQFVTTVAALVEKKRTKQQPISRKRVLVNENNGTF